MTERATFGEFLQLAWQHVGAPDDSPGRVTGAYDVVGVSQSLGRVVTVMARYLQDITAGYGDLHARQQFGLTTWARAGLECREALVSAARYLRYEPPGWQPGARSGSELARRLDTVARSLTAGHDLLQTHVAVGRDGVRQPRSEWATAITSPPATRALLAEIASMARRITPQAADLALSPSASGPGATDARRRLNAACQWLWVLNASVQMAHQQEPASTADRDLLHAIPVNMLPPRRLPEGSESITALCEGTVTSAERVRQLAWGAADRAAWSPAMSVTSLHQVAGASTVTSHNCHVLLETLASSMPEHRSGPLRAELTAASEAASRAREVWRHVAGAVDHIHTDSRRCVSGVAVEARDLAIWTGRLAYAEPGWTPASGPDRPVRVPESLVREPEQVPLVVAAVHQASHTLTRLARAQQDEVRAAAWAGRILVTTRSLPDDFDIPHPFARAPEERVYALLAQYRDAETASHQAGIAVGRVATTTRAPSRILTSATEAGRDNNPGSRETLAGPQEDHLSYMAPELTGPLERTLLDLGVTRGELLRRAAELDHDSEQLLISAVADREAPRKTDAVVLNRSTGTAVLINSGLATGDPRAIKLLRRSDPLQLEPEPEA